MARMILSLFNTRDKAEIVITELEDMGYNPRDISLIMRDGNEGEYSASDEVSDVAGGAISGATTGTIVGALAGLMASMVIPGVGALFVGGPIATALGLTGAAAMAVSGAVTGAAAGGLIGALTGLGLSDTDAKAYEDDIRGGAILIAVPIRQGEEEEIRTLLTDHSGYQLKTIEMKGETEGRQVRGFEDESDYAQSYASEVRRSKKRK